jgi:hypothetical protein
VSIDYAELRQRNAERLAELRGEMAAYRETHPELDVMRARRLVGRAKIVERNALDVPMVYKVNNNARDETQGWNEWFDARFNENWLKSLAHAWPLMLERLQQEFDAMRTEIAELKKQRDAP